MDDTYGKCHELSIAAVEADKTLTLVRGWYICPVWGERQHWWTIREDGTIFDPSASQFPSKGTGEYIKFNGMCSCEYCGSQVPETDAYFVDHHVYCSGICYGHDVGF